MSDNAILLDVFVGAFVVGFVLMMIPIIIAFWRGHPNRWLIVIVTILLGATSLAG